MNREENSVLREFPFPEEGEDPRRGRGRRDASWSIFQSSLALKLFPWGRSSPELLPSDRQVPSEDRAVSFPLSSPIRSIFSEPLAPPPDPPFCTSSPSSNLLAPLCSVVPAAEPSAAVSRPEYVPQLTVKRGPFPTWPIQAHYNWAHYKDVTSKTPSSILQLRFREAHQLVIVNDSIFDHGLIHSTF